MEKRVKQGKKGFLICEIILLILITISVVGCVFLYGKVNDYKKLEKEYKSDNKKFSNILKTKEDELKGVKKDLNYYRDLDTTIESIKTEYFASIKTLEEDIKSGKSDRKIAYITFDDGPYYNTYRVLDILDENDVKATFFTISMNGEYCYDNKGARCYDLYKEYYKRGHTIANHTYTHGIRYGLYSSADSFINAIERQEEHIKNMTGGYKTNIMRFPGGSSQAGGLKGPITERLRERGYGWVDWTAQDGDGKALYSNEQAWANIYSSVNDKIEVILLHDYNTVTTNILGDFIKWLKENGYECYPLFYDSVMVSK
jgi:peptidoglycan/xylan/chitin deacetylase (PgdA/CDA1 family)